MSNSLILLYSNARTIVDSDLVSIPAEIGSLVNLKSLELHKDKLASLPEEIGRLASLNELDIADNSIVSLPASISSMSQLAFLTADANQLSSLPADFCPTALHSLYLGGNFLSEFPSSFSKLVSLELLCVMRDSAS